MSPLNFIPLALAVAGMSKDPSTKVGAIVLDDDCNVLSIGFNGFPRGIADTDERLNYRPTKYSLVSHAEMNAIAQAARTGARLLGSSLLVTLYPCSTCAKLIIQSGIRRIFTPAQDSAAGRWGSENELAKQMFFESGVAVIEYEGSGHANAA